MIKEEKESSLRSVVRNLIENRISANVEDAVINCCRVSAYGQEKAANQLRRRGIIISGSNIRSVWLLSDFESFKKHLVPILMTVFYTLRKLAVFNTSKIQ